MSEDTVVLNSQDAELVLSLILSNNNNNSNGLNTIMTPSSSSNHNHNSLVFNNGHKTKIKYYLI